MPALSRPTDGVLSHALSRHPRLGVWEQKTWMAGTSPAMTRFDSGKSALVRHPQRVQVGFENLLLLAALVGIQLAQAHDRAQRLGIEAGAFRFGIHVADVVGGRLLLFLEALDALDDRFELILGEAGCAVVLFRPLLQASTSP